MAKNLGRLERVPLRAGWAGESSDFTPWLASPENIELLGEAIGLELLVEGVERPVGAFSADILCRDAATGDLVLIENQLEDTDHRHLGQLLTYGAGVGATTLVWIARRLRDEHRAALDWLNDSTSSRFNAFGLEIELWRIGSSPPAPKFNVVSKPNDWTRSVSRTSSASDGDALSDTKKLQLEYWTTFREHLSSRGSLLRPAGPNARHWLPIGIGRRGFHLTAIASTYSRTAGSYASDEIRAELVMRGEDADDFYQHALAQREELETRIGEQLHWYNPENAKRCAVQLMRQADLSDRADWPKQHEWLQERLEGLHEVFGPLIRRWTNDRQESETGSED